MPIGFIFIKLFVISYFFAVPSWSSSVFTLETGYFSENTSYRAAKNFTLSWLGVQSSLFDRLSFNYFKQRPWLYLNTGVFISVYLQQFVGDVVYHEFGHQVWFKSLGLKSQYENGETSFFKYFIYHLSQLKSKGNVSAVMNERTGKCIRVFSSNRRTQPYLNKSSNCLNALGGLLMSSSGLNYQMNLASELGKKVHSGQGHVYEWLTHLVNRYSTGSYYLLVNSNHGESSNTNNANDVENIVSHFKILKKSVSHRDLKRASLLSLLLSSTTWAYFISIHHFLNTGDTKVPIPILHGFWLPDVETYFGSSGLSYRISTGYQLDKERHFPLYFEFIGKGSSASELSFGYFGKLFKKWKIEFLLNVSNTMDGSLEILKQLRTGLHLGVGVERLSVENFFGERYIGSLQKRNFETNSWINLKWQM